MRHEIKYFCYMWYIIDLNNFVVQAFLLDIVVLLGSI